MFSKCLNGKSRFAWSAVLVVFWLSGCQMNPVHPGLQGQVKLITLDPGHFHAALVQKTMYPQVDPTVYVYAPAGPDGQDHLKRIGEFNARKENPTFWNEVVYTGDDYLLKMLNEKKGNVVVISGKNARKTEYIAEAVGAGFNVLADKPMIITWEKFPLLIKAFETAERNNVLLYDIMTERHEITTMLQKELSHAPAVFGLLQKGTPDNPAVTKESVHHFFKEVAGAPLKRPAWFFDTDQQGEGLVDVTTHLVDLIQWECFPEKVIDYKTDIQMLNARRWTTPITLQQFQKVTRLDSYPDSLNRYVKDAVLNVFSNGEMNYRINGVCAKVSVTWNFQAPQGAGDTHYSIMRGTKCNLIIRQGAEQNYKPMLYVEAADGAEIEANLKQAIDETLQVKYPGIRLEANGPGKWRIVVPGKYHVGHEAHFAQVMEKYLRYLEDGSLPAWEIPNMIAKYYTTTTALKMAKP
jgi:predicted dehydrogenase